MNDLADQITAELQVLVGLPLSDCWRAANMQIFEFGTQKDFQNRKGMLVQAADLKLHVQCKWRMVDANRILFGREDIEVPADKSVSLDEFDWDKHDSFLDVSQREWFKEHRACLPKVIKVVGDCYGGCCIQIENKVKLEILPCGSFSGKYSEHWRLIDHRSESRHFVVSGYGAEIE